MIVSQRKKRKRGREGECAHMSVTECCRTDFLTMTTVQTGVVGVVGGGGLSGFLAQAQYRGPAVLTPATSLLSEGQILEYQ